MAVGDVITTMEFRARDYTRPPNYNLLPRSSVHSHPLLSPPQVDVEDEEKDYTLDPLSTPSAYIDVPFEYSHVSKNVSKLGFSYNYSNDLIVKEWTTFKKLLVQKYPVPTSLFVSSIADVVTKSVKALDKKSSANPDELDDYYGATDDDMKIIPQQEYVVKLMEMKAEIVTSWHTDDYVTSLKLGVKIARLLRDTTSLQFYPTLFSLVTDVLDMLGDMVWDRIKRKAEFSDDGDCIFSLPEDFGAIDVCSDAKDVCHNWFCKVGSIRELLPRIYLELAILPCWRFLHDERNEVLQRLVKMIRGLGDPVSSTYCHLYMVYRAQKVAPCDKEYLITSITNINLLVGPIIIRAKTPKKKQMLVRLMEPPLEYIMKCLFKDPSQEASKILVDIGLGRNRSQLSNKPPYLSLIIHYLLKELPPNAITSNSLDLIDLIEGSCDASFDQVVLQYQNLDAYLKVVDGYIDILLHNQMKKHLELVLEGIAYRTCDKWITDGEQESLQSIFVKILSHMKCLEDILKLNQFVEIMHMMHGSSKNVINMRILDIARRNNHIDCPTTIEFLFEVCQDLHDGIDAINTLDSENGVLHHSLSRFIQTVDFGTQHERHLSFLVRCRDALSSADELKETLVHRANHLAIKILRCSKHQISFVRSCLAFCEVTIPGILDIVKQLNLYITTAEVALLSGLVCHSDELIDSAMSCFRSLVIANDSRVPFDVDRVTSIVQKLCSLLVMVPGNPSNGVICIPKSLLSLANCQSRWITTKSKVKISCAIISLLATLAQNKLPYYASGLEVLGNDDLFFDDPSYHGELISLCSCILQDVVHFLKQEVSPIVRGSLALKVCNCIALNLRMNGVALHICNELMEMAKSPTNPRHYFVLSASKFIAKMKQIN